jgi:hypothetical protein
MTLAVVLGAWPVLADEPKGDLAPPVKLQADGKPIDVDVGHAAPCVADFAGDGTLHLLVGQFGEGKLRVYRNAGSAAEPRFDKFTWFLDGQAGGQVPAG